jgi:hypothetical protein
MSQFIENNNMKNHFNFCGLFIVLLLLFETQLYAQKQEKWEYIEVLGQARLRNMTKLIAYVDNGTGEMMKASSWPAIQDEAGKEIEFNSFAHICNYLGESRWELIIIKTDNIAVFKRRQTLPKE